MAGLNKNIVGALVVLVAILSTGNGQSYTDRQAAIIALPYDYLNSLRSLRPVAFVNDSLTVNMDLNIVAILDFDEQNGYIEISGYMDMEWDADPTAYIQNDASKTNFTDLVDNAVFWKPPIVLVNALKRSDEIGSDGSTKIRYNFLTRSCSWKPWLILRAACTPDVKFYPFDKQSCSFKLAASGYNESELRLAPKSSGITFNFFEENGEWNVTDTTSMNLTENGVSILDYTLTVTRRPLYHILNVLAPVILINLLNVFVFILPTESGERIGFAITCFLSDMVLLGIIMAILPTSSAPISYLTFYTFVMMVFSAGMALATVLTVRIHHKSDTDSLPSCVTAVSDCFSSQWCVVTGGTNSSNKASDWSSTADVQQPQDGNDSKKTKLTWKKVAAFADIAFFLGFLAGQVFFSVAYLVPLILNV